MTELCPVHALTVTTFEAEMVRLGWSCAGFSTAPAASLCRAAHISERAHCTAAFTLRVLRINTDLQHWVDEQSLKITIGGNVIEKLQDHCHVNFLVYVFHYKQMVW